MAKTTSKGPLLALTALGAGLFAVLSSKKASALEPGAAVKPPASKPPSSTVPSVPATSAPPSAPSQTVSANGHSWKLVKRTDGDIDVFAPAGSWGPHDELLVCRFRQGATPSDRTLVGTGQGVPETVLAAAMKDLGIRAPGAPSAPSVPPPASPSTGRVMPASLQAEMVAVMMALGVDSAGVVRGPVTAEAVRRATELSSRLDQAGFPEAATAMRGYAQQAAKMLPQPSPAAPAVPGVPPELMAQIQRALELERDPAKLELLRTALTTLPQSPERDMLIGALDALVLQIRAAQAISTAATEIDQQMGKPPPPPSAPPPSGARILKLVTPNMTGPDVRAWQQVLRDSGYTTIVTDGVFGPATDAATKDWQRKRGLVADGDVGPATRAKIGTPPTAPLAVPSTPTPRPDPAPKTAIEVNAEALATHLLALQAKYGVAGSKGKQDTTLVKRFQSAVGGIADGLPGPGTMAALANHGVGTLPAVMYWGKTATKAKDLPAYRQKLQSIANAARAVGHTTIAAQIEASAARETGAGGLR